MRIIGSPWTLALLVLATALCGGVGALEAQQPDTAARAADSASIWQNQRAYEAKRAELVEQLHETQQQLSDIRGERVRIEARVDNAYARSLESRARVLLMSSESDALLELDSMLASAQNHMQEQRDRMQSLGDAVRRRSGAVLVVLLGAQSIPAGGLTDVRVQVDSGETITHGYSPIAAEALEHGALDEIYRREVLPIEHGVAISATVGGQEVRRTVEVAAREGLVTYVKFSVQNGQLVPSTWTSKGTSPF